MPLSLRQNIMLLLGTAILLTLLTGGLGSCFILKNSAEVADHFEHATKPAIYIEEIKSDYWRTHAIMLQITLDKDPARIESNNAILLSLLEKNEQALERFMAAITQERRESELFMVFDMKRRRYLDALGTAMLLNLKTTTDEAIENFNNHNYKILLPIFNEFVASLDEAGAFIVQESITQNERNAEAIAYSLLIVWLIIIASLTVLLLSGYFLSNRVFRTVNRITGFASAISEGDFSQTLEQSLLSRADAAGVMGRALEKMKANLSGTIERLNETAAGLSVASEHKSVFLSRMSHEIRTQLNAVIGMTYRAKKSADPAVVQDSMEKIAASSTHLLGLINDILDMSKIEAGKFDLLEDEFSLEKILMSICTVISVKTEEKAQRFNVTIPAGLPVYYLGDSLRLSQVLTNILGNASKFTPEGGEVSLAVDRPDGDGQSSLLRFTVEDTGIGLTEEQLSRLFTPFEQADSGISRQYGGSGLGLAICERIVRLMGGDIEVESRPGRGSRFVISARLRNSPRQVLPLLGPAVTEAGLQTLLISSDEHTRSVFKCLFEKWGMGITCLREMPDAPAESAREAQVRYDLVFMDWPEAVDGCHLRLVSRVQRLYGPAAIVALAAGMRLPEGEAEARQAGVYRFITRPLFPSILAELLNKYAGSLETNADAARPEADFTGKRLLLVEDMEINREIVTAYLENTGIQLVEAINGAQAVEKYLQDHAAYDLILMDVQMPVMDGYTATRRIREEEAKHGWPRGVIVAMTANAFREDIEKCLEAGMDAHLGKPMSAEATMTTLKKYLG